MVMYILVHPAVLVSIPISILIGQPSALPGQIPVANSFLPSFISNDSYSWTQDISSRIVGKNSNGSTKVRARLAQCLLVLRLMGGKGCACAFL